MEDMKRPEGQWGKHFGAAIAKLRDERGWTQAQFASELTRAGHLTTRGTIAKTELATRPVTVEDLIAYAAVLEVEPSDLIPPKVGGLASERRFIQELASFNRVERQLREALSSYEAQRTALESALANTAGLVSSYQRKQAENALRRSGDLLSKKLDPEVLDFMDVARGLAPEGGDGEH